MRVTGSVRLALAVVALVAVAATGAPAVAAEPVESAPPTVTDAPVRLAAEGATPAGIEATGGPAGPVTCNAWVRDGGANAVGRGSKASPYATLTYALDQSPGGQNPGGALHTVCVPASGVLTLQGGGETIVRSNTVLAGDPDATLATRPRVLGRLTVTGNDVTVRGVEVTHTTTFASTVRLWGDRVSLFDSAVRATRGTCVEVGYLDANVEPVDNPGAGLVPHKVHDVVIRDNDIGPCANAGTHPGDPFLSTWQCNYSGLPGIYSQWAEGLDITGNYIHDTALRGVQLFPKNDLVRVENNLFRRNSVAVNIGTSGDVASVRAQHQATRVTVTGNIVADQTAAHLAATYPNLRGPAVPPAGGTCASNKFLIANPPGYTVDDEATLYARMQPPQVTPTVTVSNNCGPDARRHPDDPADGFTWTGNHPDKTPRFRSAVDPRQTDDTQCGAHGPIALRPAGPPPNLPPVVHGIDVVEHPGDSPGPQLRTVGARRVFVYVWAQDENPTSTLQVRIANEGGAYSAWRAMSSNLPWTLSSGASQARTVRVQVRDTAGLVSDAMGRDIRYRPDHDLSGDGFNDLLVRRTSDQVMRLYRGTSGGSLTGQTSMTGSWTIFDRIIVTPDFDGDGNADVITRVKPGRADSGTLRLYPGNNAGGFGTMRQIGTGWGSMQTIVAPGDWDRDGANDVLAVDSAGRLWLYPGTGSSTFPFFRARTQLGNSTGFGAFTFLTPGDFDGDGDVDLILRRNADGVLLLAPGNGRGGFGASTFPQIGTGWNGHTVVGTGDMNQDSFPDLVTRKPNGELWVYKGNGTGRFNGQYRIGSSLWTAFDQFA